MNSTMTRISNVYSSYLVNTFVVVLILVAALSTFGYLCVFTAAAKVKQTLRPTHIIFINFGVAELLTCLFIIPTNVAILLSDGALSNVQVCVFILHVGHISSTSSAMSLSFIAFYRLAQTCYPRLYSRITKPVFLGPLLVFTWIPGMLIGVVCGTSVEFNPHFLTCVFINNGFYWTMISINVPICLIILLSYVQLYLHFRKCRMNITPREDRKLDDDATPVAIIAKDPKNYRKTSRLIAVCFLEVVILYAIPGFIVTLCSGVCSGTNNGAPMVVAFLVVKVRVLASLMLFLAINPKVRRFVIFKTLCSCPDATQLARSPCSSSFNWERCCFFRKSNSVGQVPDKYVPSVDRSLGSSKPQDITSEAAVTCNHYSDSTQPPRL